MTGLSFSLNKSTSADILDHFKSCEFEFKARIERRILLSDYSKKLARNAERIEAWIDGQLVGLVAVYCNSSNSQIAYISNVSIAPQHRGMGLAKTLVKHCLNRGQEMGFNIFKLEVHSDNKIALSVYKRLHFKIENEIDSLVLLTLTIDGESHV